MVSNKVRMNLYEINRAPPIQIQNLQLTKNCKRILHFLCDPGVPGCTVEWSPGVVAAGRAYLFLSLSVDSASLTHPHFISRTPSSVGSRTGALVCTTFPIPATSNTACGFPALCFPFGFTPRVMMPICWQRFRVHSTEHCSQSIDQGSYTARFYSTCSSQSLHVFELS